MKSIVISLDAELAWGYHDFDILPTNRITNSRDGWEYIFNKFDTHNIPATWAVVGHLLTDQCNDFHSDHPLGKEWFRLCRGSHSLTNKNYWYGPELIDSLRSSSVNHEIASHTFSHVEMGAEYCNQNVAREELNNVIKAHNQIGHTPTTLIFPRNNIRHLDIVKEYEFECIRTNPPVRFKHPLYKFKKFTSYMLGLGNPPIVKPIENSHGLIEIPASINMYNFEGGARKFSNAIGKKPVLGQIENGLKRLCATESTNAIFHIRLHPNDITTAQDRERLANLCDLIEEYRGINGVKVRTMGQISKFVE